MATVKLDIIADGTSARQNLTAVRSCIEDLKTQVGFITTAFIAWRSVLAGLDQLKTLTADVLGTGLAMEKMSQKLTMVGGSSKIAVSEIAYVRSEAKRMGLDFVAALQQYATFINTVRGTSLEGTPGRVMFSGMAEGLAAMKMTGEEQGRVFAQITQMMAKQKIELEDVKVIAETGIPIFNMLSAAIGKSTPEMMKMMGAGQLLSLEVLPKLAESMHKNFGQAAENNANSAQGSINRFKNTLFDMKESFATSWLPTFTTGLLLINDNMGTLATTAKGLAATIAVIAASRIIANTVMPAVSAAAPYVRNAVDESSGAVALQGVTADKMRAAAALEVAKAVEAEKLAILEKTRADQASAVVSKGSATSEFQRAAALKTLAAQQAEHVVAQTAVTAATARYAIAQEAATLSTRALTIASSALKGVLSFFGGWIGLLVTGLVIAGTAWAGYGQKQEQARKEGTATLENMREQIRVLEERNRLAAFKGPASQNFSDADSKQVEYLKKRAAEYDQKSEQAVWSWNGNKFAAEADKARSDLQEFYGMKNRLAAEKETEAARNAIQAAKEKADQEKMAAEKLADDLRKLEETRLKNRLEQIKDAGKLELDALKNNYDRGLTTTQKYFDDQKRISQTAYKEEYAQLTTAKARLASELETMLKATSGKSTEKTVALQVKIEEIGAGQNRLKNNNAGELQKLASETANAYRQMEQAASAANASDLERQERFVDAWKVRKDAFERTPEYLRMELDALAGNKSAEEAYYAAEKEWLNSRVESKSKEIAAGREHTQALKSLKDELDKLNGKYREETASEKLLREEKEKLLPLEARLLIAKANGADGAIAKIQSEINAVQALFNKKTELANLEDQRAQIQKQFQQDLGVLTGAIVGYDNGKPIYAKDATSGQYSYQSAQAAANKQATNPDGSGKTNYWGDAINAAGNTINPFGLPQYAAGTNYVPKDGFAYLHEGEAVIPRRYNNGGESGVTIQGGITITMPNVTNQTTAKELARQIMPELQALQSRFRKAA